MTCENGSAVKPTGEICRRQQGFRAVIAEVMRRQRLTDAEVARALGMDRSYVGKVRRGERPMADRTLDDLIEHLRIDRRRLAMAVDVMETPELYFDPTFRNLCYYAQTVLADIVSMSRESGDLNCGVILAALTRERCETLAHHAVARLAEQFAAFDPFKPLDRAA